MIIVSYNTKELLRDCLKSLYDFTHQTKFETIVVDNASKDGSAAMVKQEFPAVKLVVNRENLGFARANNLGVKEAKGEYLWLLNSDTRLTPKALDQLYKLAGQKKSLLATPKLLYPDGTVQPQGGYLPTIANVFTWMTFLDDIPLLNRLFKAYHLESKNFFLRNGRLEWASGTAILIKTTFYRELKGLDENLFMYAEDVEFCYRAMKKGYRVDYFAKPRVVHLSHQSGSPSKARLGEYRGLQYLFRKHKPKWQGLILKPVLKLGALLRWVLFGAIPGNRKMQRIYMEAYRLA